MLKHNYRNLANKVPFGSGRARGEGGWQGAEYKSLKERNKFVSIILVCYKSLSL